jgi:hypothetical protein
MAIGLLGRYLATAPDDGRAWFQLGRFYLLDARDWHLQGHRGDPDGLLYLDFAATAFDQAIRLSVDSGAVFRGFAELERSVITLEDSGWNVGLRARPAADAPVMPSFILELGANLLHSCPPGGVLLLGSDLEALSVWYDNLDLRSRQILPLRPDRFATDSVYRHRMADAMGVDPTLPIRSALADVAARQARPGEPSGGCRLRSAFHHRAPGGRPAGWLGVGERCARRVRRRRALQRPPLHQLQSRVWRHAAAGLSAVREKAERTERTDRTDRTERAEKTEKLASETNAAPIA